jgi:hypothetical protein
MTLNDGLGRKLPVSESTRISDTGSEVSRDFVLQRYRRARMHDTAQLRRDSQHAGLFIPLKWRMRTEVCSYRHVRTGWTHNREVFTSAWLQPTGIRNEPMSVLMSAVWPVLWHDHGCRHTHSTGPTAGGNRSCHLHQCKTYKKVWNFSKTAELTPRTSTQLDRKILNIYRTQRYITVCAGAFQTPHSIPFSCTIHTDGTLHFSPCKKLESPPVHPSHTGSPSISVHWNTRRELFI